MLNEVEEPMFPTWAALKSYINQAARQRESEERAQRELEEDKWWTPERLAENRARIRDMVAMTRTYTALEPGDVSQETDPEAA